MLKVDLPLYQKKIIITRSKDMISDIKKLFTNKGAQIFDFPAIDVGYPCLLYTSPSPRD